MASSSSSLLSCSLSKAAPGKPGSVVATSSSVLRPRHLKVAARRASSSSAQLEGSAAPFQTIPPIVGTTVGGPPPLGVLGGFTFTSSSSSCSSRILASLREAGPGALLFLFLALLPPLVGYGSVRCGSRSVRRLSSPVSASHWEAGQESFTFLSAATC